MKELQYIPEVDELSYEDLCIHPNLDLPEGFKVPKFDTFGGAGNPLAHLRAYCDQLVGVGLLGKKREDVSSISCASDGKGHFRKFSSYKDYPRAPQNSYPACYTQSGYQTPPPSYQILPLNYQTPPPSYQIPPFVYQTPPPHYQNTHPYYPAPSVNCSNIQSSYQTPPPHYQNTPLSYRAPQYPNFQTQAPTHQIPPNYRQVPSHPGNNHNPPREKRPSRVFTPLVESRTQLFGRLKSAGLIQTIDPKNINVNSKLYRPDLHCAYHSVGAGHITEDCINLKHKIQDLIDQKVVTLQTVTPNINSNPVPNHGGVTINMVEVEEDLNVKKVIILANLEKLEKVVASPTKREKSKFVIMTPHQAFALVPKEGQNNQKFNQALPKSLPHLYQPFQMQNGLGEGIKNWFKEGDIVLKKMIETPVILDSESKE
uniref:Gag-pro n=1 Tax=Solanum tuberosum TaxID=4113 RepID=M1BQB8_SOLTU